MVVQELCCEQVKMGARDWGVRFCGAAGQFRAENAHQGAQMRRIFAHECARFAHDCADFGAFW